MRSASVVWPCRPVSTRSPLPHSAFGTGFCQGSGPLPPARCALSGVVAAVHDAKPRTASSSEEPQKRRLNDTVSSLVRGCRPRPENALVLLGDGSDPPVDETLDAL